MTVSEKIKGAGSKFKTPALKRFGEWLCFFALGFGMSLGSVIGSVKPFGVAMVAVSKRKNLPFVTAGAVVGYFIGGINSLSARYLVAVFMAALGSLMSSVFDLGYRPNFSMAVSGLSIFATGVVLNFQLQGVSDDYLLTIAESVLACGGAFFFYKSLYANYKRLRLKALPISDITCIVATGSILLISLSSISFWYICPARIIAVIIVLIASRFGGDRWGMIFALSMGFALGISSKNALFVIGAIAFSTMIASLFLSAGGIAMGIGYLCSTAFFSVAGGGDIGIGLFVDSLVAVVAFMLFPQALCDKLDALWDNGRDAPVDASLRQSVVMKLRFASSAMTAISDSVDQVREKINDITRRQNEKNRDEITDEDYLRQEIILEKTNQIRMVASDQFFSIAGMLEDLAFEFDDAEQFDENASQRIRRLLGDYEIYPSSISVIEDKFGRIRVEIMTEGVVVGVDNERLCKDIGKICSRYFEQGRITNFKNESMLTFTERPSYKLSIGFAQHSACGELCGDTVKILNDNKGHSILIISDGMGKGGRAALDGAMGAGLLSKLINAGFGFDSALKVVNSALLIKSNDESLATLDVACIDLFTGKCEIYKAGAPASYIIKNESITKCELSSMPAGILRGIEFAKRTAVLSPNDEIALLSDGVTDLGDDWVENTLYSLGDMTVQESADYILASALEVSDKEKLDDMSVIFARLEGN